MVSRLAKTADVGGEVEREAAQKNRARPQKWREL